jgi:hypothetical protein
MNIVFAPFIQKFVIVFLDDILVYIDSWHKHVDKLRIFCLRNCQKFRVLLTLLQNILSTKLSKCELAQHNISYLGHIISKEGVATYPGRQHQWKNIHCQQMPLS